MTAAAQPVSGLNVSTTGATDHSSHTDRFGDGNMGIQAGATNNAKYNHGALSLPDAGRDGVADLQTTSNLANDFNADQEGPIVDDYFEYDEDMYAEDAGQSPMGSLAGTQNMNTASTNDPADAEAENPDPTNSRSDSHDEHTDPRNLPGTSDVQVNAADDYIWYSEDEEDDVMKKSIGSNVQVAQEDNAANPTSLSGAEASAHDDAEYGYGYPGEGAEDDDTEEQPWIEEEGADWAPSVDPQQADATHTEGDDDYQGQQHIELYDQQDGVSERNLPGRTTDEGQQNDESQEIEAAQDVPSHAETQAPRDGSLHPVTINYNGEEFWLFKPYDSEDDDWFLTDKSLAMRPFTYLFQACRAQLEDDLTPGTELGFRFDDFHAMELYEDCTACAYTCLKELVDAYTALHAQDGLTYPEPLYITLQFRTRVLTLVNELKQAVQDNAGFSGLNRAIAKGQSNFNNVSQDDETYENQNEEEQEGDTEDGPQPSFGQGQLTDEVDYAPLSPADAHDESVYAPSARGEVSGSIAVEEDANFPGNQSVQGVSTATSADNVGGNGSPTESGDGHGKDDDDYIDYSDEDDEDAAAPTGLTSVNGPSSGSSTVQGDDTSFANMNAQEPNEAGDEKWYGQYDEGQEADNGGPSYDDGSGQVYDQGFADSALPDVSRGDPIYYDNDEDADFEQQEGQEGHSDYHGVDNALELTGASENIAPDGTSTLPHGNFDDEFDFEIGYEIDDDNEEAARHALVSASSAAPPAIAPASGLNSQGSPQGQKRPIDAVDGGIDGAGQAMDAKKIKV